MDKDSLLASEVKKQQQLQKFLTYKKSEMNWTRVITAGLFLAVLALSAASLPISFVLLGLLLLASEYRNSQYRRKIDGILDIFADEINEKLITRIKAINQKATAN